MIEVQRKIRKRIFGLDLLRVLSILLVLCSHTSWIYPQSSSLFSKAVDMTGFFGVELFFVMSGFLIGSILFKQYIREDYDYKTIFNFLNRRLIRILPNYYLIVIVNIIIGFFIGLPISESWRYFFLYQNFASPLLPFFPESWSLPVKEYGYLILVLLLFILSRIFKTVSRKIIFVSIVSTLIIFFLLLKIQYNFHTQNTTMLQWNLSLRSVVIYRIDSVLMGVFAGFVYCEYSMFWKKTIFIFMGIGLSLLLLLLFFLGYLKINIHDNPFFWNVICLPMNSLALICFLPFFSEWKSGPLVLERPVELISELSYAIYLVHYSIVLFLMKHFIDTIHFNMIQLHFFTFGYLLATFILSYLLYNYFEKPMTKLRDLKI
jgi:peptidoglycan/LPS O-acetylase OafA/YrhL